MTHPDGKAPGIFANPPITPTQGGALGQAIGPAPTVEFQRLLEQLTQLQESSRGFEAAAESSAEPPNAATQGPTPTSGTLEAMGATGTVALPTAALPTAARSGLAHANDALEVQSPPKTDLESLEGPDRLAADLARAEDQFRFAMDLSKRLRDAFEHRLR